MVRIIEIDDNNETSKIFKNIDFEAVSVTTKNGDEAIEGLNNGNYLVDLGGNVTRTYLHECLDKTKKKLERLLKD